MADVFLQTIFVIPLTIAAIILMSLDFAHVSIRNLNILSFVVLFFVLNTIASYPCLGLYTLFTSFSRMSLIWIQTNEKLWYRPL